MSVRGIGAKRFTSAAATLLIYFVYFVYFVPPDRRPAARAGRIRQDENAGPGTSGRAVPGPLLTNPAAATSGAGDLAVPVSKAANRLVCRTVRLVAALPGLAKVTGSSGCVRSSVPFLVDGGISGACVTRLTPDDTAVTMINQADVAVVSLLDLGMRRPYLNLAGPLATRPPPYVHQRPPAVYTFVLSCTTRAQQARLAAKKAYDCHTRHI